MKNKSTLETHRLILRAFETTDIGSLCQYRSLPKVFRYVVLGPETKKETTNFIKYAIAEGKKKTVLNYIWAVVSKETGKLIGDCNLPIIHPDQKEACLGYTLHPDFWNQGYATEIAIRLIEFGLRDLKLHRIFATCDVKNIGSAKVLEKAGMRWEGTFRKNILQKGKWRDTHQYAILSTKK